MLIKFNAEKLKLRLVQKELTPKDLAAAADVNYSVVAKALRGGNITLAGAIKICKALDVLVEDYGEVV